MSSTSIGLRNGLAQELAGSGHLTNPLLRDAFAATPRELFLGDHFFRQTGTAWEPVHRDRLGEREWLALIYQDATWVTQVDGVHAADASGPLSGRPTSSSTLPSLVVRMIELAGIRPGDKILEIGTGTGYSTAILCRFAGDGFVHSVEYDGDLATRAADRIRAAGHSPHLVTGDGLAGYKAGADYDAIVATCAVRHIPPAWLWQLREGGSITTTISGWMLASGLIRLTLGEDGTATGRFADDPVSYMLARPHERPPRPAFHQQLGQARVTTTDPGLLQHWTGRFVAQLAAPSAELMTTSDEVLLFDTATGSQAWTEPSGASWIVHQHGPLRLWDQIEAALTTWRNAGAPGHSAFGMTVDFDNRQTIWLGQPDGPSWDLPA
ncbi:ATP-grasp peptide maturase system methyltransferase [Streptomyces katsurahamanus]|uniref:Protein-L-isoaspartate O-methyltransferase n=1 Tax=Streptomyces katsurahamanus TaxID=2577098 RepID=A0ABW9P186_9ACTN|nr:ATP-grasp peptide maturase system methyltransferase [Streptomyces katsurahamanus]MQS39351.1 methyltransferase [Streptomyces katsurahamanus]